MAGAAQEPSNLVRLSGRVCTTVVPSSHPSRKFANFGDCEPGNLALNASIRWKLRAKYTSVKCSPNLMLNAAAPGCSYDIHNEQIKDEISAIKPDHRDTHVTYIFKIERKSHPVFPCFAERLEKLGAAFYPRVVIYIVYYRYARPY